MSLHPLRRVGLVLVGVVAACVIAAGPPLAATSISETGRRGEHRLIDTREKPGATCEFADRTRRAYFYEGLLSHIDVRPPRVWAFAGTQDVGWRFTIWRQDDDGAASAWKQVHKSALQVSSATTSRAAAFSWMGTDVTVPRDGRTGDRGYDYAVRVHMIWYDADESVSAKSVHRVDRYLNVYNGSPDGFFDSETSRGACSSYLSVET